MKLTVVKELNIQKLYDDLMNYGEFAEYSSCEDCGLTSNDLTPKVMAEIFNALADEADRRSNEED